MFELRMEIIETLDGQKEGWDAFLHHWAQQGERLLDVAMDDDPEATVKAIDTFVANPPRKRFSREVDPALSMESLLGGLWGLQLIRKFEWIWTKVTLAEDDECVVLGVFPTDRSLAIYPVNSIVACLDHDAPVAIYRSFKLIADGRFANTPSKRYEDILDTLSYCFPYIDGGIPGTTARRF